MTYAKRFGYVLETGDASDILALKMDERNRTMKALALLAKFQGNYDDWKAIRQRYGLKWASEPATVVFNRIINNDTESYSQMLQWIKSTIETLPSNYGNIILFTTLTGLRASESLASLRLTRNDADRYLKNGMLEHFRYPDLFIRRTKKAFVSVISPDMVDLANSCQDVTYEGLIAYLRRRRYSTNLKYCRRVFATHLRTSGVDPEIIDLLQGRVPRTVFARHYFRPDFNKTRIADIIKQLHLSIIS